MFDITNKVAIVTGGANGIGQAVTDVLSRQGARVYFLDIDKEKAKELEHSLNDRGQKAQFIPCNVAIQKQMLEVVERIYEQEKQLDILINNAGIAHIGRAADTSEEDFDQIFQVNVKGVYNGLYACIPKMKASGGGAIVNLASAASLVGLPDRFAYSMSKGAVMNMTYTVARDYVHDNIRCNAVAPGRVHTPFVDAYLTKYYPGKEKEMFEKLSKTQPIGRMGEPEEIAGLILYLCSDEAKFITGSIFPIDGGFVTLNT